MVPINTLSKLVHGRSQLAHVTKSFVTSGAIWRENRECPDKFMSCSKSGGRKTKDNCPEQVSKKQRKICFSKDSTSKYPEENDGKKQRKGVINSLSVEEKYLEANKQGESSSCGQLEKTENYLEENQQRTSEPIVLETDSPPMEKDSSQHRISGECSCPPYGTPKCVEEKRVKEQQKTTPKYQDNDIKKEAKKQDECVPQFNESRKQKDPQEDNQCRTQKKSETCGSISPTSKNMCPQENEVIRDHNSKRSDHCGPEKTSCKDSCREEKDVFSKYNEETGNNFGGLMGNGNILPQVRKECNEGNDLDNPNKTSSKRNSYEKEASQKIYKPNDQDSGSISSSYRSRPDQKNESEPSTKPCGPTLSTKVLCPLEEECANIVKQFRLGTSETCRKSVYPIIKGKECVDEQKENVCLEDIPKNKIKLLELPACGKVDSANESVWKFKEIKRGCEQLIATQEDGGKLYGFKSQVLGRVDYQDPAERKTERSNMIQVVLVAILAAVLYCTYNEDFESEELGLDRKLKDDKVNAD